MRTDVSVMDLIRLLAVDTATDREGSVADKGVSDSSLIDWIEPSAKYVYVASPALRLKLVGLED
jgi:hypothetical protein